VLRDGLAGCYNGGRMRASVDRRGPVVQARQVSRLSRKQWAATVILGLAVVCAACGTGSFAGLFLMDALPESLVGVIERSPTAEVVSPSALETTSPTATSTTAPLPSPTSTVTATAPFVVPQALPTSSPREPFVADGWEPDDTAAEATSIEVGATQSHNLHVEGDSDWLCFEAEAERTYAIGTSQLGREVDTVVSLYDDAGKQLVSDDDGGEEFRSSLLFWMAEEDVGLCVMVRSFADTAGGRDTEYNVSVRLAQDFLIDEYEPDGTRGRASHIEVEETQEHNRHASGDVDWIFFEAQLGTTYVISTSNLGDLADTAIYLYDAQDNQLGFDDDSGAEPLASRLRWTAPASGVFYIKVVDWLQGSAGPGTGYDVLLLVR
jgi:hypothetical protein